MKALVNTTGNFPSNTTGKQLHHRIKIRGNKAYTRRLKEK
jgi:hypothetical protein